VAGWHELQRLPTTPLSDRGVAERLGDVIRNESARGGISGYQTVGAVELFLDYLTQERKFLSNPFLTAEDTGRDYVIAKIQEAIEHYKNERAARPSEPDALDF